MALKAKINADAHKALDPATQALYTEIEGGFILAVDSVDGWALEDVADLKNALAAERTNVKTVKNKLSMFGDIDPTDAKTALSQLDKINNWKPDEKVQAQIEAREKQLIEKHTKESGTLTTERDDLRKQLEAQLIDNAGMLALTKHKGSVELLLPHIRTSTRIERGDDGKYVARIVDGKGNTRISTKSGSTDPMSIDELVESMRDHETFKPAFAGTGASGTGATGGSNAGSKGAHVISSQDARNPAMYRAAKEAAAKAGASLSINE
jgi:hypothetical protein